MPDNASVARLLFLLVLTNAGGEGKTLLALLLRALLTLADEEVGVLDADGGNYSAAFRLHSAGDQDGVRTVRWSTEADRAEQIIGDHVGKHMILDSGANMAAANREIMELIPELRRQVAVQNYRPVVFLPVSTNKAGAVGAITALAPKMEGFERFFVRVNRDGSGNFEEGLDPELTIDVGHLQPGLQSYIEKAGGLVRAVSQPPAQFDLAASMVADWMLKFATQPVIQAIIGVRPALALQQLGRPTPPRVRFTLSVLDDCTNAAIRKNLQRSRAMAVLDRGDWSAGAFREVANLLDAKPV